MASLPSVDTSLSSKARLRVLHVVDSLERGGLERLVTDLAIEQQAMGYEVAVFSLNPTQGFAPQLQAAGIQVIQGGKQTGFDRQVLSRLRGWVRTQQVQVVHAHNFVPNYYAATALWGLLVKPGQGPVLVGTCHDMGTRLSNRRLRWFYRLSLWRTARVAMVGKQVYARFVGSNMVPAQKAVTVLNAVPLQRFIAAEQGRQHAREVLGVPAEALVIGCVGRLVGLKNHRLMIQLMPAILQQYPQAYLVLLGGGELETQLRDQIRQANLQAHVLVAGEYAQVADLLPAFDLFALPSLTEGVSIALLEACATGLAIIATDVGGNPEIIQSGYNGLLVPPNDAQAMLQAVLSLLADPQLRKTYAERALDWVRKHASLQALCVHYEALYRAALAPRATG